MAWTVKKIEDFEDKDKKLVVSMACDEKLLVVGVWGWAGEARVYDILTGDLKFTLKCNNLQDTPEPFSHDYIEVWLSSKNIFTWSKNDDTIVIWDREGNKVAQDIHKNREQHKEINRIMAMSEEERQVVLKRKTAGMTEDEALAFGLQYEFRMAPDDIGINCMYVTKDGKIYAGNDKGFLIMAEEEGIWKMTETIGFDCKVTGITADERYVALKKEVEDQTRSSVRLWDDKEHKFVLKKKELELKNFAQMWLSYPFIFIIGGESDKTGVEVWNFETGKLVRHLLQGEKEYRTIHANGKHMVICQEIDGWNSGEENDAKLAVYDYKQLLDENIKDEDLWNYSAAFSLKDLFEEYVVAALNDKNLVVNHGKTKFSVYSIE